MKGDPIPGSDHIARYVPPSRIATDGRITGAAFELKEKPGRLEEHLSANWLEYLRLSHRTTEMAELCHVLRQDLTLSKNGRIAVLQVEQVKKHVRSESGRVLRIIHLEKQHDPSYSGIFEMSPEHMMIAELIAQVVLETHPVVNS